MADTNFDVSGFISGLMDSLSKPVDWEEVRAQSRPITREDIEALFQRGRENIGKPTPPCCHVVAPQVQGWTNCANCFQLLYIREGKLADPPADDPVLRNLAEALELI